MPPLVGSGSWSRRNEPRLNRHGGTCCDGSFVPEGAMAARRCGNTATTERSVDGETVRLCRFCAARFDGRPIKPRR